MSLRTARIAEDKRIAETALASNISYRSTAGTAFKILMAPPLDHFFNHQTHHRGQEHDMLCQTGTKPPQLDLPGLIRERDE